MRNNKIKIFLTLLFAFITINLIFAIDNSSTSNEKAPNIILYDINGKPFNLRTLKDKNYTLINFSATYCKPCKEEIPEFIKLQKEFSDKILKIYLIFIDPDLDKIKSFVKENKISLNILHDKYNIVKNKYGVINIPVTFLLNSNDIIIYKAIGYRKSNIDEIRKIIKKEENK